MAGQNNKINKFLYSKWNDRAVKTLTNKLNEKEFVEALKEVKLKSNLNIEEKTLYIHEKFHLQMAIYELLKHYIEFGEINHFYMKPPIYAVSNVEGIAGPSLAFNNGKLMKKWHDENFEKYPEDFVYLVINPECNQEDAIEWIKSYWTFFMEDRLKSVKLNKDVSRVRSKAYANRDYEIYKHIKIDKKPAKDIANDYNITPEEARQIASAENKKRKK